MSLWNYSGKPFRGRVAIVTGGANGIGRATVRHLAELGAAVASFDVSAREQRDAAEPECLDLEVDVTDPGAVREGVASVERELGRVGILVNNAGFTRDAYLSKMTDENWKLVVRVVLDGAYNCTKAVIDGMQAQQWGRVINMASRSHLGNPGQANYSAAKAGLLGFTRAVALESGKFGVTVNAIAPGYIATDALRALSSFPQLEERASSATPVRRMGTPQEIASLVAFLASDEAGYITGETIHATGGRYA
jgi:3-oxoacyl-[acyl-carrier protein] reductase